MGWVLCGPNAVVYCETAIGARAPAHTTLQAKQCRPAQDQPPTSRSNACGGTSSDSPISTVGLICFTASSRLPQGARSCGQRGGGAVGRSLRGEGTCFQDSCPAGASSMPNTSMPNTSNTQRWPRPSHLCVRQLVVLQVLRIRTVPHHQPLGMERKRVHSWLRRSECPHPRRQHQPANGCWL